MKHSLVDLVTNRGYAIRDGGLATELEHRGADLSGPLWSARVLIEHPELVRDVHLDYFRAGADIATSASYQASAEGLREAGYSLSDARRIVQSSVRVAREARNYFLSENGAPSRFTPLIAGSVGCYGAYLANGAEYRGNYARTVAELVAFHRPRVEWLIETGVDVLAFETIPCETEAHAVAELLRDFPETEAWVSFSCRDDAHVCEGQTIEACVRGAAQATNVVAIGVNCTAPRHIAGLIGRLRSATDRLVIVYPNRGEGWDPNTRTRIPGESPVDIPQMANEWRKLGANIMGGCCRTTPGDIAVITKVLRSQ